VLRIASPRSARSATKEVVDLPAFPGCATCERSLPP
jgi:hypothetical protein